MDFLCYPIKLWEDILLFRGLQRSKKGSNGSKIIWAREMCTVDLENKSKREWEREQWTLYEKTQMIASYHLFSLQWDTCYGNVGEDRITISSDTTAKMKLSRLSKDESIWTGLEKNWWKLTHSSWILLLEFIIALKKILKIQNIKMGKANRNRLNESKNNLDSWRVELVRGKC